MPIKTNMFIDNLFTEPIYFLSVVVIVVFSVCCHEFAHAYSASSQGDDTAKEAGFFTLNPMVHMGGTSIVLLLLAGICWGSTPVRHDKMQHWWSPAFVAISGPIMNLLLMVVCVVLESVYGSGFWAWFFSLGALLNAVLFLLNMIPIPPLDGFGVVETLLPAGRPLWKMMHQYGFIVFIVLFFLFGFSRFLFESASDLVAWTHQFL